MLLTFKIKCLFFFESLSPPNPSKVLIESLICTGNCKKNTTSCYFCVPGSKLHNPTNDNPLHSKSGFVLGMQKRTVVNFRHCSTYTNCQ